MSDWRNWLASATLALAVVGCGGSSAQKNPPPDGGSQDLAVNDLATTAGDLLTTTDGQPGHRQRE